MHTDAAAALLRTAIKIIDEEFGEGYAKKNPALVASFVAVIAQIRT